MKKFHKFTNNSFRMIITWKTRNIRSFFPLRYENDYKWYVIYKGKSSCGSRYISETERMQKLDGMNIIIQLIVQNHQNILEATSTTVLHGLPFQMLQKNSNTRKNLKAWYIAFWKPDLNEQKDFERLDLFRNGVT